MGQCISAMPYDAIYLVVEGAFWEFEVLGHGSGCLLAEPVDVVWQAYIPRGVMTN